MSPQSIQVNKAHDLLQRFGGVSDGSFTPDGVPLSRIADSYGTPFYLYHSGMLADRVHRVRDALGEGFEVSFSIKANPSLAVSQVIREAGAGAEVASAGELAIAEAAGFDADDILFAGPAKTDDELRRAARSGILAVNVESLGEIDRLAAVAESEGREVGVGLRLNPEAQLMGSGMRMGGTVGQFGLDQSDLAEAATRVKSHPQLKLRGIHVYTATQVSDADPLVEHCRNIAELALQAADASGEPLEMVDFGGGFGVPYFEKDEAFDLERFASGFREMIAPYREDERLSGARMIFELGRYLVADAGLYITRAVDVKEVRGKTFVVTDGGMNHHLTATGNMGQVFRKPYPILNLSRPGADPEEAEVAIAGPCCTPLDVFGTGLPLAEAEVGDLIGVFYSGAYGYSASNLGFLSHPSPAEVMVRGGEAHLLRAGGRPEDVLAGQEGISAERSSAAR